MAENSSSSDQPTGSDRPATGQSRRGATPATVFGDGSTKEQQDAQVKAAEETNRLVKAAGDAERKARDS